MVGAIFTKMRFFDFKCLLLSFFSIGLLAVYVVFQGSCAEPKPTVDRDEENKGQDGDGLVQGGNDIPFCDDSSKCIVFKPRTGEYSYEKAPIVLELPKNLGKYAFMTGLVTTGKVRSIKIFVDESIFEDEAIFDEGSEKIEKFLSIFSVSGTKKESSLLSLSAINDRPIPIARLDFSLDENDTDVTYVRVEDKILNDKYIKEKFDAYKVALKGEQASGVEEEEAKKLQEGLAWLEKGYETIRDELAKKYLDALIEKMKREYLNHVTVTDLYATEEKRIDSETYKELLTAVKNAERDGANDLRSNIDSIFDDKKIVDTSTFLEKMTEEIDLVVKEITDKIAVLQNGVNSVESENPVLAKDIIELSDTYKKTKEFIKDIETIIGAVIAGGVGGHEAKLDEVDRFIASKRDVGDADGSRIDGVIREEIKQGLSDKMAALNTSVKGWKGAMDKEGLSAKELDTSPLYRRVETFVDVYVTNLPTGGVTLFYLQSKSDSVVREYVFLFGFYKPFINWLEAKGIESESTFVSSVYKEILGGLIDDIEINYLDHVLAIGVYKTKAEAIRRSSTYSVLNTVNEAAKILLSQKKYEEGYRGLSGVIAKLGTNGGALLESFVKVMKEEKAAKVKLKTLIQTINKDYLLNDVITNVYKQLPSRKASTSYRELKKAVDVANRDYSSKRYEAGYTVLKAKEDAMGFADANALLTKMREEIGKVGANLDGEIAIVTGWQRSAVGEITKGSVRRYSSTYKEVKAFLKANPKSLLIRFHETRLENYTRFIDKMKKDGIISDDTFLAKVKTEVKVNLEARLAQYRVGYIDNVAITSSYTAEAEREMSPTYKAVNRPYKAAKTLLLQKEYVKVDEELLDIAVTLGTLSPIDFAKKVIEEIEAAVLSGKVITKSEGVVDYIVSSFYSFIDRLIESRDKIKNTDRETVKVFQGNVAGGNDLGLDLDVLKEKASWGNFSRFKVFVEAGGLEDLPGFAVDFRYTQKDAGLKLSCKNSSSFMTNRGINLGDFKTTDMYNCDLSWVKKPAVGNIKFRVKGVNIAAADEYKFINAFMTNDFLFSSDKVESSKVKHMPVIDVEIVVLDTASFNAKCRKIGCNVAPEKVG